MSTMQRLNAVIRALTRGEKPAIERTPISGQKVGTALREQVLDREDTNVRRQPLDGEYWTTTQAHWKRLQQASPVDNAIWTKNQHDCDDFAWAFRNTAVNTFGLTAIGWVNDYSATHAYNCFVDSNEQVWFMEPDDDSWGFHTPDEFPVDERHQLEHASIIL